MDLVVLRREVLMTRPIDRQAASGLKALSWTGVPSEFTPQPSTGFHGSSALLPQLERRLQIAA